VPTVAGMTDPLLHGAAPGPRPERPGEPAAPASVVRAAAPEVPVALVDRLAGSAPGPALDALLDSLDTALLDDAELVEYVAASQRLQAREYARGAAAAAVLAQRPSMQPAWSPAAGGAPAEAGTAGDELAMRLSCSRRTAIRLVRHGRAFAHTLTDTGDALATGRIGTVGAQIIAERLHDLPTQTALDVQARVLPEAGRRTPTQLRRDLEKALIVVDPAEAASRAVQARSTRRVERPQVLPDGMAGLHAVLPAATAARIYASLDSHARTARRAGDPRTLDQLRADGMSDLILHTGCSGAGSTVIDASPSTGCRVVNRSRAQIRVTVALSTLLGLDEQPAELAGHGPIDATAARALAEGGVWQRIVTAPLSGTVLDVGRTRYRPPAGIVEHVQARDRTCVRPGCSAAAESCDLDHTIEFHGAAAGSTPNGSGAHATFDVPGTGRTAADNLGPLCRRDHRLKTDGGHVLRQPEPGVFEWTSPAGLQYLTVPGQDGYHERLGIVRSAAHDETTPAPTAAPPDAAPPF
jgi:hypothetical protein